MPYRVVKPFLASELNRVVQKDELYDHPDEFYLRDLESTGLIEKALFRAPETQDAAPLRKTKHK